MPHFGVIVTSKEQAIENLIFISEPTNPFFYKGSKEAVEKAKNSLVLLFDDITYPIEKCKMPTKEDIEKALSFAEDCKGDIVVSCTAGVSRSSAIAYLIAAKKFGVEKAYDVLNFCSHWPNDLIISLGAEIFNLPVLNDEIKKYKDGIRKVTNALYFPER